MNPSLKLIATLPISLLLISCSNNSQNVPAAIDDRSADHSETPVQSTDVLYIAAAANLAGVLPTIIEAYQTSESHAANDHSNNHEETKLKKPKIEVTYASSGKLFAQINSGAPYDIFLSADQGYPAKYQQQSATNPKNLPFTYARGQLALYSSNHDLSEAKTLDLTKLQQLFQLDSKSQPINSQTAIKITIANPELAPYGASAKSFLQQQGLYDTLNNKKALIQAENIGQAFQYAHTATTDYGFVALSQLVSANVATSKYIILAPQSYPAILQDGIVIRNSAQATDFSHYLQSDQAQQLFAEAGYLAVSD